MEQERKRFETWARPDSVQAHRHPETGEYLEPGMSAGWSAWQAAVKVERDRCSLICHERFMELEHFTNREDPTDDWQIGLQSEIAKELRDKIMMRSNAKIRGTPAALSPEAPLD